MRKRPEGCVSIGEFDILATCTYARGLIDGLDDDEAKQRGMVASIMGPRRSCVSATSATRSSKP